jgi:hypothetical protein
MFSDVWKRSQTMKYLGIYFDRSLSIIEHIDRVIERARKGLSAIKVMAAADCEQRHLFLLYQRLVVSIFEYALAIQTFSNTHIERLERIQNEAMRLILGCTRDTSCTALRYLLDLPTIENRIKICRARAYLRVVADNVMCYMSFVRQEEWR